MKFNAQLIKVIPRVKDVASFRFKRPPDLKYKPGQYMLATLKVGGDELMHPFSFSSSPTEEDFIEFTKKFTDSEYSKTLKTLRPGDSIKVDAPYGQFTFTGEYPQICLLAGGIGITPFWSICKYCTAKQIDANVVLLYGCRSEDEITFYKEFNDLQAKNPNIRVIFVISQASSNWKGLQGIINADLIKTQVSNYAERIFYACGPPAMVDAMKNVITDLGLPITQLKVEALSGHT